MEKVYLVRDRKLTCDRSITPPFHINFLHLLHNIIIYYSLYKFELFDITLKVFIFRSLSRVFRELSGRMCTERHHMRMRVPKISVSGQKGVSKSGKVLWRKPRLQRRFWRNDVSYVTNISTLITHLTCYMYWNILGRNGFKQNEI